MTWTKFAENFPVFDPRLKQKVLLCCVEFEVTNKKDQADYSTSGKKQFVFWSGMLRPLNFQRIVFRIIPLFYLNWVLFVKSKKVCLRDIIPFIFFEVFGHKQCTCILMNYPWNKTEKNNTSGHFITVLVCMFRHEMQTGTVSIHQRL